MFQHAGLVGSLTVKGNQIDITRQQQRPKPAHGQRNVLHIPNHRRHHLQPPHPVVFLGTGGPPPPPPHPPRPRGPSTPSPPLTGAVWSSRVPMARRPPAHPALAHALP